MKRLLSLILLLCLLCTACSNSDSSSLSTNNVNTTSSTTANIEPSTTSDVTTSAPIESSASVSEQATVSTTATELKDEEATSPSESDNTPSESTNETNPFIEVIDCSVHTKTEYAHADTDIIKLGNDEKFWITISATPASLIIDDFIFDYDSEMLEIVDVSEDINDNNVKFEIALTSKKAGVSEILICPGYDLFEYGEDAEFYVLTVRGLDSKEGRVVYVSSSGDKYHYSSSCISYATKTTLNDALAYEYEPCGKCAT